MERKTMHLPDRASVYHAIVTTLSLAIIVGLSVALAWLIGATSQMAWPDIKAWLVLPAFMLVAIITMPIMVSWKYQKMMFQLSDWLGKK